MRFLQPITGYWILVCGILVAPLLPFYALLLFPIIANSFGIVIASLGFAIVVDSFLLPTGASFWTGLTPCLLVYLCLYHSIRTMLIV